MMDEFAERAAQVERRRAEREAWLQSVEAGRPVSPGEPEEWQVKALEKAKEDAWWAKLTGR